jgi:putative membrane protein
MAAMTKTLFTPDTPQLYFTAVAAMAICGAVSFGLLIVFSRLAIKVVARVDYRAISLITLVVLIGLVFVTTGLGGLIVLIPATAIGLIPTLFGSRRMNCLGVLLLPITLNMAGVGPGVARVLGLLP